MANVLPPQLKKIRAQEFNARLIRIAALGLIAAALATMLALVPSYLIVRMQMSSAFSTQATSTAGAALRSDLARSEILTIQFAALAAATSTPQLLQRIFALRPSGMSIDSIDYVRGQKSAPGSIVLNGIGGSRDAINTFRLALGKDPTFTNVVVPVGALVGSGDGSFSVTLNGIF